MNMHLKLITKLSKRVLAGLLLSAWILLIGSPALSAQEVDAKLKQQWTMSLEEAKRNLLADNERESAAMVSRMLVSMQDPLTTDALKADGERLKPLIRPLVRRGLMESAASVSIAQWFALTLGKPWDKGQDAPVRPDSRSVGTPSPEGLVLYMSFDAPDKEGVVRDESGAGNDGRVFGATWVPQGRIGGAYQFNIRNIDDRIVIPHNDSLSPEFVTVAAWIKSTDNDGFWNRILDKDWRRAYCLSLGGDYTDKSARGKLVFEDNGMGMQSSRVLGDGNWHHVAATYDGHTNRMFVDGVQVKKARTEHPGPLRGSRCDLCIGNSVVDHGNGEFLGYDGLIDEVRIYNRALSAAEISALTTTTPAKPNQPEGGPATAVSASRTSPLETLSQQALNATAWVLAPLDESLPGGIRQNLTALREDLLDEAKAKPVAGPDAYAIGRQLCDTLVAVLDERDATLVRVGYRAAQANANTHVTSQALEARRNYMMSWPQYAREKDQAGEIFRQHMNNATLTKELPKVEWSNRTAVLRKTLDGLYAKYREALRQGKK